MTHHTDPELLNNVLQLLTEQGHDGFAEGLRLLVNEAMRVERHHVLQAQPYSRATAAQQPRRSPRNSQCNNLQATRRISRRQF